MTVAPSTDSGRPDGIGRRELLGGLGAAALAGSAGCLQHARALLTRDPDSQVSLRIKTLPADADPRATHIARSLAKNLDAAGVDVRVRLQSREALYRDVLVNRDFDVYVGRIPGYTDPDFLRPLVHSRYAAESGWQNPFGFADLDLDRLLERQRRERGAARRRTLASIQRELVEAQPFTVVASPEVIRAVDRSRLSGWGHGTVHSPLGYLSISDRTDANSAPEGTGHDSELDDGGANRTQDGGTKTGGDPPVRMALKDRRRLENLNPLSVVFRTGGSIMDLVYDPLGREVDGRIRPWLAKSWEWTDGANGRTLDVQLREDLTWHDGESLTAHDVAFTYRFLDDTALGGLESPVPAPRFRGRSSVVSDATALDDATVKVSFGRTATPVARWALTVPILPEHVWKATAKRASISGIGGDVTVTEALVRSPSRPVGSGPLRVTGHTPPQSVTLSRFDDHFLTRMSLDNYLEPYRGGFEPGRLRFRYVPSTDAAVTLLRRREIEGTATGLTPSDVPAIGRDDDLRLFVSSPRSFYHVGYNVRRAPLSNTRFRRTVARLLDRGHLVAEAFDGFAEPAVSPLARYPTLSPDLAWNTGSQPLPFLGEGGKLNVARARRAFRRAGYRYGNDGALLHS